MEMVLLGLGANLDDPAAQIAEAARRLGEIGEVRGVSSLYRSAPVGYANQPDFLNAVCVVGWNGSAEALLEETQRIEHEMGRVRGMRNGPRRIDIDLVDFGGMVHETERLTLPHPRLHERAFVLEPLAEVAPEWRHPVLRRTARELLDDAGPLERIERVGQVLPSRE